jgi:alpha-beta hydrolase superfamily lysophospholipase
MVKRFLKRDLWASLKITYAFITKAFGTNPRLCRECFFSPSLSDEDVARFAAKINASSELRMLDLKALKEELPVQKPAAGSRNADVPVLVLGGALDFVVDREGLEETASWFAPRAELVVEPSLAHDVMLDADWEIAAARIERWLVDNGL